MNKAYLLIICTLISIGATAGLVITESISNQKVVDTARLELVEKYKQEFQILTNSIRNELLKGNFRYARNSLQRMASGDQLSFKIRSESGLEERSENFDNSVSAVESFSLTIPVYFSESIGAKWGQVTYALPLTAITNLAQNLESQLIWRSIIIALIFFAGFAFAFRLLWSATINMNHEFQIILNSENDQSTNLTKSIWAPVLKRMSKIVHEHTRLKASAALADVATQVAHDIRSPLSALRMATQTAQNIDPERKSVLLAVGARIESIANDLLRKYKTANTHQTSDFNISEICKDIIREKEISLPGIKFELDSGNQNGNVNGEAPTFARILSNLINNSVEAAGGKPGIIKVDLNESEKFVQIMISDNGRGIPQEIIDKVGTKGFTYGKESGHGLGLSHAKETIEKWGGKLHIQSQNQQGTTITIDLPKVAN